MKRRGFTLVEILVVVSIMLLLSTLTLVAFRSSNTDKMRSAARVVQSALLGAKDRAMHAKDFRGVRFVRDANGPAFMNGLPCLVAGFSYVKPIDLQTVVPTPSEYVQLERLDIDKNGLADSPEVFIVRGIGTKWFQWATSSQISRNSTVPDTAGPN